jgi:Tfp pilus assembly protein PilO
MDKIKKEMPDFSGYLFHTGQELTLITTLEGLASRNGVVQKVNSSNLDSISGQKMLISLTITGPYNNAISYLNDLEKLPYFITAANMQLSTASEKIRSENPQPAQQVNLSLDLRLYVSP